MQASTALLVHVEMDVHNQSEDGVEVALRIDGDVQTSRRVQGKQTFAFGPFALARGAQVEVVLGSGASTKGDQGKFRFRLLKAQ